MHRKQKQIFYILLVNKLRVTDQPQISLLMLRKVRRIN